MGDFNNNALIRNEGYDYLISKGLIDTYCNANIKDSGITVNREIAGWEAQHQDKRLDLILTNKDIKIEKSNVIFNNINKQIISYHYGVEVFIEVK